LSDLAKSRAQDHGIAYAGLPALLDHPRHFPRRQSNHREVHGRGQRLYVRIAADAVDFAPPRVDREDLSRIAVVRQGVEWLAPGPPLFGRGADDRDRAGIEQIVQHAANG
jgi:hypothetical protein